MRPPVEMVGVAGETEPAEAAGRPLERVAEEAGRPREQKVTVRWRGTLP